MASSGTGLGYRRKLALQMPSPYEPEGPQGLGFTNLTSRAVVVKRLDLRTRDAHLDEDVELQLACLAGADEDLRELGVELAPGAAGDLG